MNTTVEIGKPFVPITTSAINFWNADINLHQASSNVDFDSRLDADAELTSLEVHSDNEFLNDVQANEAENQVQANRGELQKAQGVSHWAIVSFHWARRLYIAS